MGGQLAWIYSLEYNEDVSKTKDLGGLERENK